MKKYIFIIIALLLVFISCQKREWNNPFDPSCPKETWTPANFEAVQEGSTVKLTWSQPLKNISGFKITKKVDPGTAMDLQNQTKDITQYIDAGLTGGEVHIYTITAYAGANLSSTVEAQITPLLIPALTTTAPTAITTTTATGSGNITSDGGAAITARGVCWSTTADPTTALTTKTTNGTGTGTFTGSITGLTAGTTYHVRAYATNSVGTAYGSDISFTTTGVISTLTTTAATAITTTTATCGGNITADGGASVTARGVCWSTSVNPTIALTTKTTNGTGTGTFTSSITGLTASTLYYVRAYATNSIGTAYGNEVSFTTTSGGQTGTVTDIDGNVYNTVTIGTQVWMKENLKTTKYRDGTAISNVMDNTEWGALTTGAYCWYNNDAATYKGTYGALYNWYVVASTNPKNVCPTGWHVPSDAEWTTLTDYLGGESVDGGKLKETGTTHWAGPNTGATNETGFTALPGGYRYFDGTFDYIGSNGYWWSATEDDATNAWLRDMGYSYSSVYSSNYDKTNGFSVRCLQGVGQVLPSITTSTITAITSATASSGGSVTSDGGASVTARGVCWSTTTDPTTALTTKTSNGTGTGTFTSSITGLTASTLYYVRAYATNSIGTAFGNEVSFTTASGGQTGTVTDIDGNVYNTVTIGTQVWMKENLKTTKYRDGTAISNVLDNTEWGALTTGAYCWYKNDAATYKATYGALYNWYVVASTNSKNVCPTGWHVPSDAEWLTLTTYLGGESVAGGKLKETGTTHWASPNTGATNETGFTALPGGLRNYDGPFIYIRNHGYWWSATESTATTAWHRYMYYSSSNVYRDDFNKHYGFSVRCLQGVGQVLPAVTTSTITAITSATATSGGNITADGGASVTARGVCWSTTANPTITDSKTSDGTGTGTFNSSITGLTASTLYYVRAYATNSIGTAYGNEVSFTTASGGQTGTVTDIDGNVYNTVTIGTQVWMKENLKTTKYRDGTAIPNVTDNTAWGALPTDAYCWYNNDAATYKDTYGALYNWYVVASTNPKNVCPTGWHVPSDAEWTTLTTYLGGEAVAGGKLKEAGTTHWASPNTGATNETGFTALPGGDRDNGGTFGIVGSYGGAWWSATESGATYAWYRLMYCDYSSVGRADDSKGRGFSVRCLRDN